MSVKCLLVDDQEEVLSITKMLLEMDGISVTEASDGKEALEIIKSSKDQFDVIVSDIIMPNMTGVKLLSTLKTSDQYRLIPVILMSGYSEYTRDDILEFGAVELLEKPINSDDLVKLIFESIEKAKNGTL